MENLVRRSHKIKPPRRKTLWNACDVESGTNNVKCARENKVVQAHGGLDRGVLQSIHKSCQ